MFELSNGQQVSLEYIQAAAEEYGLNLEDYIEQFGVKQVGGQEESPEPVFNHISKDEFLYNYEREGDAEKNMVSKLNEIYKDKPFNFSEARMGTDNVRVTGPNNVTKVFPLNSFWNYGSLSTDEQSIEHRGAGQNYNDFIDFIESNDNKDTRQKQVWNKTNILPGNYPIINTGEFQNVKVQKLDGEFEFQQAVTRQLDVDETNKLADVTSNALRKIYDDPAQYGIRSSSHSYDTQKINIFEGKDREKINDKLYDLVLEETGYDMSKDQFIAFLNGNKATGGLFQNVLDTAQKEEKYWNFVNSQVENKDIKVFDSKYYQGFVDDMLDIERDDDGNVIETEENVGRISKRKHVKTIEESYKKIEDYKKRLENPENEDVEHLQNEILREQNIIKEAQLLIGNLVTEDDGYTLSSNFFEANGYTKASADRIANNALFVQDNQSSIIAHIKNKSGNANLTDREAMQLYYDGLFKRYFSLQKEAKDKKIKINFTHHHPINGLLKLPGINVTMSKKEDQLRDRRSGNYNYTYNWEGTYADLHKNGFSSRDAAGWGIFDNNYVLSKEDKEWMQTQDAALDDNLGARRAMFNLLELDIDPATIEKPGFWGSMANTSLKAFGTHFFGASDRSADEAVASLSGKDYTQRYILDQISELQTDYNYQNRNDIKTGKVNALEFTSEQKDQLARTFRENVGEGVGHFMPMLVELAAITAVTKGTGAPAYLTRMIQTGSRWKKMLGHIGLAAIEEGKMRVAGFKPTSGAAFYTGGVLMQPYFNIGGRIPWLNALWNKTIKAGPIGAASMELASLTELAYDDFMDIKDFSAEFNDMYGDMSEVTQRFVTNSMVFGIVGTHNIKAFRMRPNGKIGLGTDLMTTGGKFRAVQEIQAAQRAILGEGQKGRNRKYENLTKAEKEKYDGYQETIDMLNRQAMVEELSKELDIKDPNFEANYEKRYTKPFQKIIQEAVGKDAKGEWLYKGYDVKFVSGKTKNFHGGKNMSPAQFIQGGGKNGKDLIIFNKEVYNKEGYKGKDIHEFIGHAAFRAIESANPGMTLQFKKNMADVFRKYDKQIGKSLTKNLDNAPESLKKIIEKIEKGRSNEIKNEEYLAYMLEAFSNPRLYYELYATSAVKEIKANFESFFEEFIPGYKPKIRTAEDFVGFMGRLTRDIRLDVPYAEKLTRYVSDNPLKDLKLNEVDLLSLEISQNPRRAVEKKMNSADIVGRNTKLETQLKDAKSDAAKENVRGELIKNNMAVINEFVKQFYDPFKGGERSEFYSETLFEVVKLTNKYDGRTPYGAYIRDGLFGYNPITKKGGTVAGPIGRRGNILDRFAKTKRRTEDISIDADGNFLQLEGGMSSGGSVGPNQAKAGLIVYRERLDISDNQIKKIESKIDLENLDKINYATYEGITLDYTMELVGGVKRADRIKEIQGLVGKQIGKTKEVYTLETATERINEKYYGESNKNIKEKLQWIFEGESANGHANWKTYYGSMPHGAVLGSGKTKIEGLSTNISDALLNGRMYEKISRTGEEAQASAAKTGKTSGLPVQNKIEIKSKEELAERFGVKLTPEGTVDFNQTKIKAQGKDLRAIDAGFKEMDKAIRNQVTREYLERIGNETVNPQLRDATARNALYQQIGAGKSEQVFSRDLRKAFGDKAIKEMEFRQALHLHQRSKSGFVAMYGEKAYDIILDIINHKISNKAVEGVEAQQAFTKGIKTSEFADIFLNHEYAGKNLSDNSKLDPRELATLRAKYVKQNESILELLPAIKENLVDGNKTLVMDLLGMHRKTVGKVYSSREGKLGFGKIKELLTKDGKGLPKEINDMWSSINWSTLKGAYNSTIYTMWRQASAVGGVKGREMLAKNLKENPGLNELLKFYDVWNRTLEHWVHSAKNEKIKNQRLGHIFKLKKSNAEQGKIGERNLAPGGYYQIPPTGFFGTEGIKNELKQLMNDGGYTNAKGGFTKFPKLKSGETSRNAVETYLFNKYSKFEHLKSSSEQSLMSALMIANKTWSSEGYKASKNYRGIYGRLAEFNMIDFVIKDGKKIDAKTSNADIFRFGQNLELSKNIWSVKSGLKKSLYQEIMESQYAHQAKNLEKLMENRKLDQLLEIGREKNKKRKGISIFDFDDTLAKTNSKVRVTMPNGKKFKINATEFAKRDAELSKKGATYDFSEFNKVIDGKKGPLFDLAMKRQGKFGSGDIFVLTARPKEAAFAIHKFLKGIGLDIKLENIKGLADGRPEAKADFIKDKYIEGYNDFYFADDMPKNVRAVRNLLNQLDVKSDVQQALNSRDLSKEWNKIVEGTSGVAANKVYSKAKAQVKGSSKGRWKFWIPPSAEDFVGLITPTLGKGKKGDAAMAWYKKNLLDPYARAENSIAKDRVQLMRDFHALKKEIKSVPKGLRDKIKEGPAAGFTKEHAMRVYIWNQQKMEVPGLSKTDMKQLVNFVKSNKDLKNFADKLILMQKGDAYAKPTEGWLAGTITTDFIESLNTNKRAKYLREWKENKDIIFSEANLNKYEATYGSNARKALENMLERMESGRNRKKLGGYLQKLENEILDWTNNSVGAIMFLNSRSAVLQTISALNYINFKDNNPLAAAKALGNGKQFWKDFSNLFNSEFLVQRRDGLKLNISESEIAEMANKGGVKGAISYLLNKGFLFTRYADSFAIASGGASFYRNRINTYLKSGMSKRKAEELAFRDFQELTEQSQQSSRPDRISAQQASGAGRVVLAFANTPMQYARLQKRAIQDLAAGRGDKKTNISKVLYYGVVQNIIFNALQQALFAIGFDEDPDDQQQIMDKSGRLINGMLDSQLRGLGYVGAGVATIKNVFLKLAEENEKGNPKYENAAWEFMDFSPPISSKVTKIRSATRSLDYDLDDMKSKGFHLDNPAYMATGNVLSATLNIPVDRVIKKLHNIQDALDEDQEMWARAALLAGWSEWDLGLDEKQLKKLREKLNEGKPIEYEDINYENITYEDVKYD